MILSFHPCVVTDENRICAGRQPDQQDQAAMERAAAVILPQGCTPNLHRMAQEHCRNLFPNYDARFDYPGKTGQIRLFRHFNAPHPETVIINDIRTFCARLADDPAEPLGFPYLIKLDWGGEGRTIFLVRSAADLDRHLFDVLQSEESKQTGILVQRFVPCSRRVLRVTVVGCQRLTYWRVVADTQNPLAGLAQGGVIDRASDPHLQAVAVEAVDGFCDRSGINLAGFDLIFEEGDRGQSQHPLFLEINYFFGREGLGGSAAFYQRLNTEIRHWINRLF